MSSISAPDFQFVAGLVRQRSAIDLQPGKEYLVEARLAPVALISGYLAFFPVAVGALRGLQSPTATQVELLHCQHGQLEAVLPAPPAEQEHKALAPDGEHFVVDADEPDVGEATRKRHGGVASGGDT